MKLVESLRSALHPAPIAIAVAGILFVLWLSEFWTFVISGGMGTAVVALSVGIVYGRAGMVSLCQFTFAGVSVWVISWLTVNSSLPFVVMLALGGLAAIPLGLIIGLLSLRLRGVNLAVATLGFSAAAIVVFRNNPFPGAMTNQAVKRPSGFESENGYFLFCCLVLLLLVAMLGLLAQTRTGRAWLAVRHSERATAALGLPVANVKLLAFSTGAFVAGIGGGLLVGQNGVMSARSFEPFDSLLIFAVAVLVGARYVDGAIAAGLIGAVLPELLREWGIPLDVAPMFFGIGVIFILSQGADGAHGHLRAALEERRNRRATPTEDSDSAAATVPDSVHETLDAPSRSSGIRSGAETMALSIRGLTVNYGAVVALDSVDLEVAPLSVHGLIGPNGAGKSTFIDAVTGFVAPASGTSWLGPTPLDGMPVHRRADAGLRRTFQQGRSIPELTVGEYLEVARHKGADAVQVEELLEYFGCPPAERRIGTIDVATRRLVEVAACVGAGASVVLLDEPGAGLGDEESAELGRRIRGIPAQFGCAVLLVEHDMEIVTAACDELTVLDFGRVVVSGDPQTVLHDPAVIHAYLGEPLDTETPLGASV